MKEIITNSVLFRLLAAIILFLVMVLALAVAAYDLLSGRAIQPEVLTVLGTGLGIAVSILNVNYGVRLQENGVGNGTTGKPGSNN